MINARRAVLRIEYELAVQIVNGCIPSIYELIGSQHSKRWPASCIGNPVENDRKRRTLRSR